MNYHLKYTKESQKSGCFIVHNILSKTNQRVKKGEPLIVFTDSSKSHFYYYESPLDGYVTSIDVTIGQEVELNDYLLFVKKQVTENIINESSYENDLNNDFSNSNFDTEHIGCFSFLIRAGFVLFYCFFPTYETTFANSLSEELNTIQFWIGLLGTLLITYYISVYLVLYLKNRKTKPKHGFWIIFVLNGVCWFVLPNILIDWSGDILVYLLSKLD